MLLISARTRQNGVTVHPRNTRTQKENIGMHIYLLSLKVMLSVMNVVSQGSQLTGNMVIMQCMHTQTHTPPFPTLLFLHQHYRCDTHQQPNARHSQMITLNYTILVFVYSIHTVYYCKCTLFTTNIITFIYFIITSNLIKFPFGNRKL